MACSRPPLPTTNTFIGGSAPFAGLPPGTDLLFIVIFSSQGKFATLSEMPPSLRLPEKKTSTPQPGRKFGSVQDGPFLREEGTLCGKLRFWGALIKIVPGGCRPAKVLACGQNLVTAHSAGGEKRFGANGTGSALLQGQLLAVWCRLTLHPGRSLAQRGEFLSRLQGEKERGAKLYKLHTSLCKPVKSE